MRSNREQQVRRFITPYPQGQAALVATIFLFLIGTAIVSTWSTISIATIKTIAALPNSLQSYYVAESGIEDSLLRLTNSNYAFAANNTITIGESSTTVSINQGSQGATVTSTGMDSTLVRKVVVALETNTVGASFSYGIQVGSGGLTMRDNSVINGNVYSNGSVVGQNHATVTGDVIVASGVPSEPDSEYTYANADHSFALASTNKAAAQSFRPLATGPVTQVAVNIAKVGTPNDNLRVRIVSDNGNKPSGTTLTQASIPASVVGTVSSWINIGFSDTPTLTAGTRYWVDVDSGTSHPNSYWKWRKDTGDTYASETAMSASGCCSGSTNWSNLNADLDFKVWVGGTPTRIEGMTIGDTTAGSGRANVFVDSTIHGSPCPNSYCIIDSPAPSTMPLSGGSIDAFLDQAAQGDICAPPICNSNGDLIRTGKGSSATIGPMVINGDLKLFDYSSLILTGTVRVMGNIDFNNHCTVTLDESYGSGDGVIVADGWINVANNCSFAGSGQIGSYPLVLSMYPDGEDRPAIDLNNHADGVVFYASEGTIEISNNSTVNSLVGYAISIKNNATITYDSGLLDMSFESGPTGGFTISSWKEEQ
ncbi:MAG: choice-of-anchor R domain-containing protein [Patescibacteria group bacterium]